MTSCYFVCQSGAFFLPNCSFILLLIASSLSVKRSFVIWTCNCKDTLRRLKIYSFKQFKLTCFSLWQNRSSILCPRCCCCCRYLGNTPRISWRETRRTVWRWRDPVGRISCWGRAYSRSYDSGTRGVWTLWCRRIPVISRWKYGMERGCFVTWLYTPDLRYIQRFSEVMTFCPRILPCIPIWAATLMRKSFIGLGRREPLYNLSAKQ